MPSLVLSTYGRDERYAYDAIPPIALSETADPSVPFEYLSSKKERVEKFINTLYLNGPEIIAYVLFSSESSPKFTVTLWLVQPLSFIGIGVSPCPYSSIARTTTPRLESSIA